MTDLSVRPYVAADRERVVAHLSATWRATYQPEFAKWSVEHTLTKPDPVVALCGGGANGFVIEDVGADIIGFVACRAAVEVSYICAMYVRPSQQRRGLGTRLLARALMELPPDLNVVVYAMVTSTWALSFYERNGFRRFEEKPFDVGFVRPIPSVGLFLPRRRAHEAGAP